MTSSQPTSDLVMDLAAVLIALGWPVAAFVIGCAVFGIQGMFGGW